MSTTQPVQTVPAYLPFSSFRSAVQSLRVHGLPPKVDKTAWGSRSGTDQGQILNALRFLKLIDDQGQTQPLLDALVNKAKEDSEEEKNVLRTALKGAYGKVFALDLTTATPGQLNEAMGEYDVKGATRDRAVRFFLKVAQHCSIQMSSRLTINLRDRSSDSQSSAIDDGNGSPSADANGGTPRRRKRRSSSGAGGGTPPAPQVPPSGVAVKSIALREAGESGGSLTLNGTFNPFELGEEEQKLVYDIIALMKKYEKSSGSGN